MQLVRSFEHGNAALVGWGIRVMLVTTDGADGVTARRLASLGGQVETVDELFTALGAVMDDPLGYQLLVIDADCIGGIEAGRRAFSMLGNAATKVPVILVSRDCAEQTFPEDRSTPAMLRAPLSAVSLRVGFEHALRDRLSARLF